MKNNKAMYLEFRKYIDNKFFDLYEPTVVILRDEHGMLIVEQGYIDCLYVEEEYRGKGIGTGLVKKYIDEYGMPETLHILNNNIRAQKFWNKIFKLATGSKTAYDTFYIIRGLK